MHHPHKDDKTLIFGKSLLSVHELSAFLNISKRLTYQLVAEGHFRALKVSGALRVRAESVLDYLERQEELYKLENGFD